MDSDRAPDLAACSRGIDLTRVNKYLARYVSIEMCNGGFVLRVGMFLL